MSPDPFKVSASLLKRVEREYLTLRRAIVLRLRGGNLGAEERGRLEEVLSGSELTYLLRLFAAFEAGLCEIGPHLSQPCIFAHEYGLGQILDQIGAAMKMDPVFRNTVDTDLRKLRNELMHGRSLVPRLSFEAVQQLMRSFRRGCH